MSSNAASVPHPTAGSSLRDPLLQSEWMSAAWSHEITSGHAIARRILGVDLVLWRSSEGLHCWLDLCIHRGARLSLGTVQLSAATSHARDCLVCPYHAWEYATTGDCIRIPAQPDLKPPAKARAQVFHVKERYGVAWIALAKPSGPPPEFPIADDPTFRTIHAGPYRFRAQGPRVIENLLDVAHLGIVHAGLLGDPQRGEVEDYEVEPGPRGPVAEQTRIWQPDPDGTGSPALVSYRYWVDGPLTAGLIKSHGDQRFGILAQVAPIDEDHCEARLVMCLNYAHDVPAGDLVAFQDRVTEQDRVVVESQRPELLPLDLQAELHLRSDRMAIAYRKWLREIGLTYGTA